MSNKSTDNLSTDRTLSTTTSDAGPVDGIIPPAPTPASGTPANMSEHSGPSAAQPGSDDAGALVTKQTPTKAAGDNENKISPSKVALIAPTAKFVITVSDEGRKFTLNLSQIHTESALFKDNFSITGIELADTDPEAFGIIYNWFTGHMGEPPVDKIGRKRFHEAAILAKALGLKECEAQLKVVNKKVAYALCDLFNDEIDNGTRATMEEIKERVSREVGSYMTRSTNIGGFDEDMTDFNSDIFEITY